MTKHILVTGAAQGIGYAVVHCLLQKGFAVFGSVRREEDAQRLAREFGTAFTPLLFDVRSPDQIAEAAAHVESQTGPGGLAGLVNNAGIAVPGPLAEITAEQLRVHLEINVMGVFHVTQAFLPSLGTAASRAGPPGRIVNISSVSGRIAYPFMGPYAASKHALEALSDAWRRELMLYGIDLVVVQPGAIRTGIWDKASRISSDFQDTDYGPILEKIDLLETKRTALPVEKVAGIVHRALTCRRPKARYVIPDRWVTYWIAPRMLPDRWLDWAIKRILKMENKSHGVP